MNPKNISILVLSFLFFSFLIFAQEPAVNTEQNQLPAEAQKPPAQPANVGPNTTPPAVEPPAGKPVNLPGAAGPPIQPETAPPNSQTPEFPQGTSAEPGVSISTDSAPAYTPEEVDNGIKVDEEKISLDLKGIDVVELVRILSIKMNKTIVPTKNVSGRINIFLNNLTFNDALDVILISQDLASEKRGDIINIMTSAEYEKLYGRRYNEKRELKTLKLSYAKPQTVFAALGQIKSDIGKVIVDEASGTIFLIDIPEKVEEMESVVKEIDASPQTEIIDIKYAKTADMKTQLTSAITTGPGELYVDDRSSKVVVSDLPQKLRKIKRIVKAFDEETRQVFIEAEIVQLTLKDEFQRGINWQKIFSEKKLDNLDLSGTFPVASSFTASPLLTADYFKMIVGTIAENKYIATLTLLQTYGDTKILSRPRISVVNNAEAKILVGSREAYITQSQSQAESTTVTSESVEFIDVGVKLNVTPTINSDGFITMKIKPEISSVRETLTTSLGSKVPIVETSEAETTVKVKDGQMIMIAGLIKDDSREDVSGFPILSQIPFLRNMFSTRSTLKKRTEVIVFLKPRLTSGAEPLSGAEIQHVTPPEMIPKDMKRPVIERTISEKVKGIQIEPERDEPRTIEEVKPLKLTPGKGIKLAPVEAENELYGNLPDDSGVAGTTNASVDIEDRIKGLKDY